MRWLLALTAVIAAAPLLINIRGSEAAAGGNVWVSLSNGNSQFSAASGAYSYPPSISSDGNYVAYQTLAAVSSGGDAKRSGQHHPP